MSRTRIAHTGVRGSVGVYHLWAHLSGQRSGVNFYDFRFLIRMNVKLLEMKDDYQ